MKAARLSPCIDEQVLWQHWNLHHKPHTNETSGCYKWHCIEFYPYVPRRWVQHLQLFDLTWYMVRISSELSVLFNWVSWSLLNRVQTWYYRALLGGVLFNMKESYLVLMSDLWKRTPCVAMVFAPSEARAGFRLHHGCVQWLRSKFEKIFVRAESGVKNGGKRLIPKRQPPLEIAATTTEPQNQKSIRAPTTAPESINATPEKEPGEQSK